MHLYNYIRQQGQIICFPFLSCVYMCGMQVNVGVHMCVGECAPACVFTCRDLRLRSRVLLTLYPTHWVRVSQLNPEVPCMPPPTSPPAVGESSASTIKCQNYRWATLPTQQLCGFSRSNPHTCTASLLTTEPSLQLQIFYFSRKKVFMDSWFSRIFPFKGAFPL